LRLAQKSLDAESEFRFRQLANKKEVDSTRVSALRRFFFISENTKMEVDL